MTSVPPAAKPLSFRRRAFRPGWRTALFLVVAFLAWKYVDFSALGDSLAEVSAVALAGLIVVVTIDRWLMAFKWRFIGRSLGLKMRFVDCAKAYYTSSLLGFVIPTSLGGDVNRAMRLVASGHPRGPIVATIVMEKVVNTAASLIWAWIGFAYLAGQLTPVARRVVWLNLGLLTMAGGGAIAFSASPVLHDVIARLLKRFHFSKITEALERLLVAYRGFSHQKGRLMAALLLGFIENVWDYALYVLAGMALHLNVDWMPFLAVVVMNHLVRKLALYLNSWSVVEAATVTAFSLVGIAPHDALAITLLRHAVNVISTLPGLLIFLQDHRRSADKPEVC